MCAGPDDDLAVLCVGCSGRAACTPEAAGLALGVFCGLSGFFSSCFFSVGFALCCPGRYEHPFLSSRTSRCKLRSARFRLVMLVGCLVRVVIASVLVIRLGASTAYIRHTRVVNGHL